MANSKNNDDLKKTTGSGKDTERVKPDMTSDLTDNAHDEERMQAEEVILDLPDVTDIPGQENVHVLPLGELADTTISSDDEEGMGLFGDDDADEDLEAIMGNEADVSQEEQTVLARTDEGVLTTDDSRLRDSELDKTDNEGELLNEGSLATDVSGADLDTSGVDSDDPMEAIGEEDEENNTYSLGSDDNDNINEGTP